MLSVGFYLEFSLQLSLHSDLASFLACHMVQFYSGVRSRIFRIFSVAFSVCSVPSFFFFGGGSSAALLSASSRAGCGNFTDHRADPISKLSCA